MTLALLQEAESLRERGALADARRSCEEILRRSPESAAALNLMAALAADEGAAAAALDWARKALRADSRSPVPLYTMGRIHQADGRLGEAEASYRQSLALDARQAKAHNNLGCVLQMQGRLDQAVECFRRALELEPGLAQAQQNLASITDARGALEAAAASYRRQAAANPADAETWNHLGNAYRELGLHREAIESFDKAIRLNPAYAEAHFSRSHELLLCGHWREGWKEHEWRWKIKGLGLQPRGFAQPEWDGQALGAGTLLLYAEQGLGDTIQFMRYAPLAAALCGTLVIECQPQLAGLLGSVAGNARIVARGEPLPSFDAQLSLMSLPHVFDTMPDNVPWNGSYLRAEPRRVERWKRERVPGARRHVGLSWAGRPQYWDDRRRSIALALLEPLARLEQVALYSLQWGEGRSQLESLPPDMRVVDFGDRIRDFGEMAALVSCLDVVVSVDSSAIHLAGALGVPAWLLLAHAPDCRWLLERESSPWYPSVRIFRQAADRRWDGVVRRVAAELAALA